MLLCFRDKILPENKPESIPECVFEILTKMPEHGMLWEHATRRQASQSSKRFKSHVDALRHAYDFKDKTHAAVAALHVAKAETAAATKEKNPRSTPNHKVDANVESDGSSYSGRSTRN